MRAGIELISSLFIVLFPYSAVSLMLIWQTEQTPWSRVAVAPVLGGEGGAVLVHLPIEATPVDNGLAVVRREDALEASPTAAAAMPIDARPAATTRASDAQPTMTVAESAAIVPTKRITDVAEVRSADVLEPVVTRSGDPTMLLAAKP